MTAVSSTHALWYVTRGSGVVALLLLTVSVVLGVGGSLRAGGRTLPRFAVVSLHRNLSILSLAFVGIHVLTTIADSYTAIGLRDAVLPFASSYRPFWLGLGTVAFDLLLALIVTSALRERISPRVWRVVHWLAYACWPVALVHAFGTGSDAKPGWFAVIGFGSLVTVAGATLVRVARTRGALRIRAGGAATALLVPVLVGVWYAGGPAAAGWAHRAGTPATAGRKHVGLAVAPPQTTAVSLPRSFSSRVNGTVTSSPTGSGLVVVRLSFRLRGSVPGAARVDLKGLPVGDGVTMTASGVSFVPSASRTVYTGAVTQLAGGTIVAVVGDGHGHGLSLSFDVHMNASSGLLHGGVWGTTIS